jgi:hypothetical protein
MSPVGLILTEYRVIAGTVSIIQGKYVTKRYIPEIDSEADIIDMGFSRWKITSAKLDFEAAAFPNVIGCIVA